MTPPDTTDALRALARAVADREPAVAAVLRRAADTIKNQAYRIQKLRKKLEERE